MKETVYWRIFRWDAVKVDSQTGVQELGQAEQHYSLSVQTLAADCTSLVYKYIVQVEISLTHYLLIARRI
jgi:hypothetical protein